MDYDEYADEGLEAPDEEWVEDESDDDADDLLSCPSCKQDVHEDTQQCPHCGQWIIPVDSSGRWKNTVWTIAAILVILSFVLMTVF